MSVKNQAMVTNKLRFPGTCCVTYVYELISTGAFDKEPYTRIADSDLGQHPAIGAIVEQNGKKITEFLPYEEHSFEYATVVGINNDELYVYGNKIGHKIINKYSTINSMQFDQIFEFHRGDKLLLEIDKEIHIVHNIDQAKLLYEAQQYGPKIRY